MTRTGKSAYIYLTWKEDQEEILSEVLQESDQHIITSYETKAPAFFTDLDKTRSFISEINHLTRQHPDMQLYRAFWIINLVYKCYYKKTKFSSLNSFYVTRLYCMHSDLKKNKFLLKA
jgi:hypothetical protein